MYGPAERELRRLGRRCAGVLNLVVAAVACVLVVVTAPTGPGLGAVGALTVWSAGYFLLSRTAGVWLVAADAAVVSVACLTQRWTVPPDALNGNTSWVLAITSIAVATWQWHSGLRAGVVATAAIIVANLAGSGPTPAAVLVAAWLAVEAALSSSLYHLVRAGARESDRIMAGAEQTRRAAAIATARRADEREHLAAIHDTAAATFHAIGAGVVTGREPWLAKQLTNALDEVTGNTVTNVANGATTTDTITGEVVTGDAVTDEAIGDVVIGDAVTADEANGDAVTDMVTGDVVAGDAVIAAATGDAVSDAATGDVVTGDAITAAATGDAATDTAIGDAVTRGVGLRPPVTSLAAATDTSRPARTTIHNPIGSSPSERDSRTPGGPPISILPQGTDSSGRRGLADLVPLLDDVVRHSPVTTELSAPEPVPLPAAVAVAICRATREALLNVARHAGVDAATVRLTHRPGAVLVEIIDRGVGFDPAEVSVHRRGISLSLVDRMAAVGGRAVVTSSAGCGTRVRLEWPDG